MGQNLASKTFTTNGTFTAPAGVTQVTVVAKKMVPVMTTTFNTTTMSFIDPIGNAFSVGDNTTGQLGAGQSPGVIGQVSSPVLIAGGFTGVSGSPTSPWYSITGSIGDIGTNSSTAALDTLGRAFAWGNNPNGQLGTGNTTPQSSPVAVATGGGGGTGVFAVLSTNNDGSAMFGISQNGSMYSWGNNANGRLGQNVAPPSATSFPTAVVGGNSYFTFQALPSSVVAISTAGAGISWGQNQKGQLGDGTTVDKSSPVSVVGGFTLTALATVTGTVNANTSNFLALTTAGSTVAWGANTNGQLGLGDVIARSSPVAVVGGNTFVKLWQCAGSSYGLTATGALFAWGSNGIGQLGDGTTTDRSSPVAVVGGLSFATISVTGTGGTNTAVLGLTTTGVAYGWGANTVGNLGDGTRNNHSSPTAVAGSNTFSSIYAFGVSAGQFTSYGINTSGQLFSWGYNGNGQLMGTGITNRSSPVQVTAGFSLLQTNPITTTTQITVVPNTAYTVTLTQPNATFGNTVVGTNVPDSVTVYYNQ